jgi:hypothetical protein
MSTRNVRFFRIASVLAVVCVIFASCSSTTLIRSVPEGAKLYVDGEPVGVTPYEIVDTKIIGSATDIKMVMDGYEDFSTRIYKDEELNVGALIGGFIFTPIPWLWIMKYRPVHTYELTPYGNFVPANEPTEILAPEGAASSKSNTEKLLELKTLLDKGVITKDEFDKEKKKVLDNN